MKSFTYFLGSLIIKCTSKTKFVAFLSDLTTGAPIVIFGTKCPSITSMCTHFAPAEATLFISRSKFAKSADNIDGEIIVSIGPHFLNIQVHFSQPLVEHFFWIYHSLLQAIYHQNKQPFQMLNYALSQF